MGYTHYMGPGVRPVTASEWARIKLGTVYAIVAARVPLEDVDISALHITFNGASPDDYEQFMLMRTPDPGEWCKTEHRPYDLTACMVLELAHQIAPAAFSFGSDGDMDGADPLENWATARAWVRKYLASHK